MYMFKCVCVHFGIVRSGNGTIWGDTIYMSKVLFMWVVKKNHPALGREWKVSFPMQVLFKIAL